MPSDDLGYTRYTFQFLKHNWL